MAELTKSGYLAGLQCRRRLWQQQNAPERARAPDAEQLERMRLGSELGAAARRLFPGGVRIEQRDFADARARTDEWMARASAPALFEPAFSHAGVRVRVDVLESLPDGPFGLREVKSGTRLKDEHLDDVVVQLFVLRGAGIRVPQVELILIDPDYERGEGDIDWSRYFARHDVTADAEFLLADVAGRVAELRGMLAGPEPEIGPGPWCRAPVRCGFIDACSLGLPEDRLARLPRLRTHQIHELTERGITRIGDIPGDFKLAGPQRRAREAWRTGAPVVSSALCEGLAGSGPPAAYLDFEAVAPAIPIYPGTRPFQTLPVQWSLHRLLGDGTLRQHAFLHAGRADPRRPFAESLIAALAGDDLPVLVYSSYEENVLRSLGAALPDLELALAGIRARLVDLLPVVRDGVYDVAFAGSFSLKQVVPVLVPGFGYDDLRDIADGGAAARTIASLLAGELGAAEAEQAREALLAYCARDTLALVELHRALRERASARG